MAGPLLWIAPPLTEGNSGVLEHQVLLLVRLVQPQPLEHPQPRLQVQLELLGDTVPSLQSDMGGNKGREKNSF